MSIAFAGIATMQLNRPPVNSLNLEFLTDILITLEKLENNRQCRGLILTSVSYKHYLVTYAPGNVLLRSDMRNEVGETAS